MIGDRILAALTYGLVCPRALSVLQANAHIANKCIKMTRDERSHNYLSPP